MSAILEIKNLTVDKINDISLSIEEGKFYVLIGNKGKTTLAKSIMGLTKYSGFINYNGNLVTNENKKEIMKNFGYFRPNILKNKTVINNIMYPLINLGIDEVSAKRKVYDIANKFEINNLLLKNISDLTHTEKKIVSFIISIIHNPKILIIDESLETLDNSNKDKILNYIKKEKITTIYLTNNEEEIIYSDNIIIMQDGKIITSGVTKKILENEKLFKNIGLPFLADLSHKLKAYAVIDKIYLDENEMINDIWK